MPGRFHDAPRCARCRLHRGLCVCASLPRLRTRTRLVLTIHRFEDRKPTNTGRLAASCLEQSTVHVRGDESGSDAPFPRFEGTEPVVLFPSRAARPLADFVGAPRPLTLIVPDGNWRQAAKATKRIAELRALPHVTLPPGPPSSYTLRAEPRPDALSTMEAIARALGVLEGPEVEQALLRVFRAIVERTLWARGSIATSAVASGIPDGARPHEPLSGLKIGTTDRP